MIARDESTHDRGTVTVDLVGDCPIRTWGLEPAERYRRLTARLGVTFGARDAAAGVVLVRADAVLEEKVLAALVDRPGVALTVSGGDELLAVHVAAADASAWRGRLLASPDAAAARDAGLDAVDAAELAGTYDEALRKRAVPYALLLTPETLDAAEGAMFGGAYKGVTDFVTKHVWPRGARAVTHWAAERRIAPNTVTTVSGLCVLAAMYLFWHGWMLTGLAFAWGMTFLDTVDGKLARVTLTSSPFGNVFDHGIDLIHPPFWYWAWVVGCGAGAFGDSVALVLWIVIGGYVAGRLLEGIFLAGFGFEMHAWRPIDSKFRLITARRNPNLAILTLFSLAGAPAAGLVAVAVWTVVSSLFHVAQIVQAYAVRLGGGTVSSWMAEPIETTAQQ